MARFGESRKPQEEKKRAISINFTGAQIEYLEALLAERQDEETANFGKTSLGMSELVRSIIDEYHSAHPLKSDLYRELL